MDIYQYTLIHFENSGKKQQNFAKFSVFTWDSFALKRLVGVQGL